MPHPSHSTPVWRTYLTPGTLLPRGRFVWWYTLLGLLVLSLGVLGTAWLQHLWEEQDSPLQHAGVLLLGPTFIIAALLPPLLASRRIEAQDYPAPKGLLAWRIGMMLAMTLLIQLMVAAFEAFVPGARAASETVAYSLNLGQGFWPDTAMVLAIAILAPLGEEWLFRGLFFRSLRDGLARWMPLRRSSAIGIALSSLLFAIVHIGDGQITQWPALFVMGVLLALTYEWTGSLLAPMLVHALNNSFALLVMTAQPDVTFSSDWLLLLAACSPLILLGLCGLLLRMLPSASAEPPQTINPPPLPFQPMCVAERQSSGPRPPPAANR